MELHGLSATIVFLLCGIAAIGLSRAAKISPVIGFFVIGAAMGPHGFAFLNSQSGDIHQLAELGVCFLLFDVGIHLSFKKLIRCWKHFLGLGLAQFGVTSLAIAGVATLLGLAPLSAILVGMILSLSSTAIVLKIISDENEENSPLGIVATEILVFQDFVAILLLVLIVGVADGNSDLASTVQKTVLSLLACIAFVGISGRYLLRPFFRSVVSTKSDEVFTASALLFVLVTSWLTASFGLSLALGAFLGGIALAESDYAAMVRSEIAPFRGLLLSLFFLTIGMSFDLPFMFTHPTKLISVTLMLIAAKVLAMLLVTKALKVATDSEFLLAFLLAQGSEFCFVLLGATAPLQLFDAEAATLISGAVGLSLALTPLLAGAGCFLSRCSVPKTDIEPERSDDEREVVIVEFDETAWEIASVLNEQGIHYRGHDRDWTRIAYAKSRGFDVYFSDPSRPRTIGRASVGKVLAIVCLVEDNELCKLLVTELKKVAPHVPFIAATREPQRIDYLYELGVTEVFSKSASALPELLRSLFHAIGRTEDQLDTALSNMAQRNSRIMFGRTDSPLVVPEDAVALAA